MASARGHRFTMYEWGKTMTKPFKPPTEETTITVMPASTIFIIWLSMGMGPFCGIFFPSLGTNNVQWWALCLLTSNIGVFFVFPHKLNIKPHGNDDAIWTTYNVFGGKISLTYLSHIESMQLVKFCGGPHLKTTLTDEGYEAARIQAGCCKCCVKKTNDCQASYQMLSMLGFLTTSTDYNNAVTVQADNLRAVTVQSA
eukprot:7389643-Prymnesium_polylepis.3